MIIDRVMNLFINHINKMKIFLILSLLCLALSYDPKLAQKLIYASAAAYSSDSQIKNWNCTYCKMYPLTKTGTFSNPVLDIYGYTGFSVEDNAIIVAFRGTINVQNWVANLDATQVNYQGCSGCLVHQGFYNAFQSVEAYLRKNVQTLQALFRDSKIFVTGHSSGGGIATIAALDLKQIFGTVDQFYSFGQPRVGNEAFANFFTSEIVKRFRVIHYADIVPHVPPQIPIPYAHFASEIWYDEKMATYKTCGAEEFRCSKSLLPTQWSTSDTEIKYYLKLNPQLAENLMKE